MQAPSLLEQLTTLLQAGKVPVQVYPAGVVYGGEETFRLGIGSEFLDGQSGRLLVIREMKYTNNGVGTYYYKDTGVLAYFTEPGLAAAFCHEVYIEKNKPRRGKKAKAA